MNSSRFIEASAGTGKTYTITHLVSDKVKAGVDLDSILIVTYTEKAAGELRDRIRKHLGEESRNDGHSVEERGLFKAALDKVDNAPIHTIHSFCQRILRELSFESGESIGQTLIDDKAVADFIDAKIRGEWAEKIEGIDPGRLSAVLTSAVGQYYDGVRITIDESIDESKLKLAQQIAAARNYGELMAVGDLERIISRMKDYSSTARGTKQFSKTILDGIEQLRYWHQGSTLFYRAQLRSFKEFQEDIQPYFEASRVDVPKSLLRIFVYNNIKGVANAWKQYKIENGLQSYNDMIDRVREKVKEESFLSVVRNRFSCAIIDEFQDTNERQWDIFKKIFLEDDNHAAEVVGDPKQSIFSFQGADVSVYDTATRNDIKVNGQTLLTNYRSTTSMINACNAIFSCDVFSSKLAFKSSASPSDNIAEPEYKGGSIKPLLIHVPGEGVNGNSKEAFAELAVKKIIELASYNGDKTNLQIFDKKKKTLRNVTLRDFAILCRARGELTEIVDALREYHIPFLKYQDKNLFASRECAEWISLFTALNQEDFNGQNEKIFNEVLLTDFFCTKAKDKDSVKLLMGWHKLMIDGKYSALLESIYEESSIKDVLHSVKKIQNLGILQQIGDYSINYLYQKNTSLDSLIKHLSDLKRNEGDLEDESGNLVQIASDFDAVQILTVHAAKGLEFPVVVSVIGNKGFNDKQDKGSYIFHEDGQVCLGFDKSAREKSKKESFDEWNRIFYVAYTRASSLMILPVSERLYSKNKARPEFSSLINVFSPINGKLNGHYETLAIESEVDWRAAVRELLQKSKGGDRCEDSNEDSNEDSKQSDSIKLINEAMPLKIRRQHSYSSLTHGGGVSHAVNDNNRPVEGVAQEFEGELDVSEPAATVPNVAPEPDGYPRGAALGNALHNTMEALCNGEKGLHFSSLNCNQDDAESNTALLSLIDEKFKGEGLHHKDAGRYEAWIRHSAGIIWRTLNAQLAGGIALNQLGDGEAIAEMEYYLDSSRAKTEQMEKNYQALCKGFIDLVFKKDGKYHILDWKSDYLDSYDTASVEARVDDMYYIQRVLYPYVAVQWLSKVLEKPAEDVFEQDFGGMHYVFLRGTKPGDSQGTYFKNWESYAVLEKEYFDYVGKKIYAIANS